MISSDIRWINYNYLFDMIMMMMWCRFMSASPGFHSGYWAVPALIGIHAFPPSLSCESFWFLNTVPFIHFHFHICYCYHRAAWVLSSSSYHSTWTLCTPPHQHNHAHPISVCNTFSCVWQKVHLSSCTLLKTPYLDTWNDIAHESMKSHFEKRENFHLIVFGFSLISSFLAGLAGRYVAKILTGLAAP